MLFEERRGRDDAGLELYTGTGRDPILLNLKGLTQVDRDPDWVFAELHDADTLLGWVPGCRLTRRLGPRRFEAQIELGAGPFKLTYSGTGRIVASDPEARTASMTLNTHSTLNLPRVRIRMAMAVRERSRGSEIQMSFRVAVSDSTGLLTHAWVDPIARELLDRTIRRVKQRLENAPLVPNPTAA